jgi:hypothetical protein
VVYRHATRFTGSDPVPWRDVTAEQGPLQFPRPTFRVFLERRKLADYLDAVMPGRAPAPPPIDFAHRKAVLIAAGPRSSTGYSLKIVRVIAQRSRVLVVVRELTPSLRDRVAARVTYPYRLITIPRTSKPTALDFLDR